MGGIKIPTGQIPTRGGADTGGTRFWRPNWVSIWVCFLFCHTQLFTSCAAVVWFLTTTH